jgi:biotin carboxyl carrier protein
VAGEERTGNVSADRQRASGGEFAYLDQALWKQFREAESPEQFTLAWLALLCRFIDGAGGGVLVLGEPDTGPFEPVAFFPEEGACDAALTAAAERAMAERQGVVLGHGDGAQNTGVAAPILIDGRLYGVVAVELRGQQGNVRNVMRQLQWGIAWIEVLLRREQTADDEQQRERTTAAFDLVAAVLEQERFKDACNAVVNDLAVRLGCDPVSIGFVKRDHIEVKAISHAAQFGRRMNLIRSIGAAMDEAVDQQAVVLYPPHPEWEYRVTEAHAGLSASEQGAALLTIPLHSLGEVFGALTFQAAPGHVFDDAQIELCDAVASVIGPILEEKRRNDRNILIKLGESLWTQVRRLFGPRYFGRKLATAVALAVVAFFALVGGEYRVTSPAVIEGLVQRSIVAPFDGYLASQSARAGEIVEQDQPLATMDDKDLALERIRWSTNRQQRLAEYDRALAGQERAEANIVLTQVKQAEAQMALLDEQLARTRIKSPFAGMVVSGDLSQRVGSAVQRGEELFTIAPLHEYRVILKVDEGDIKDVNVGQTGALLVTSVPGEALEYSVERITPVSVQDKGRNYFRVEARLHRVSEQLRPGMEGVGKTRVENRLLIRIWTEKLLTWMRMAAWKWMP